jgi:hypothetical protein
LHREFPAVAAAEPELVARHLRNLCKSHLPVIVI